MPRSAVALVVLVLVVVSLFGFVPFLTDERLIPVSTAATPPVFGQPALIELGARERACLDDVLLDPDADIARFRVGTYGRPGSSLSFTLVTASYREQQRVGPGYADNAELTVAIRGPSAEVIGRACIANEGRHRIALYGTTEDRTESRVDVTVDGEPVPADVALAFYEREPSTMLERIPHALEAMTAFRPIGTWLTWPLLFLVLIGMPALAIWALWRAFRQPNAATSRSASEIKRG